MKNSTLTVVKILKSLSALFFLITVCGGAAFAQPDEQSVARMTELITARPDSDNLYIQRGNIYLYLNRLTEALADAEKAFQLNPKNSDVFLLRGRVKIQRQDTDGAITDISRAISASPTGYALAYLMRGELYEKKGDLPRAYADYKKLGELTLNPKAPQGIARLESKMKAAGIDPAAPIPIEVKAENKEARTAFQAADKYISKLEWQAAANEYGKAIALDPEFAAAYLKRAQLYGTILSEFDKAIADYAAAIRLKPDYAEAFAGRGRLYYIYNKPDSALADFNEAIRLNPNLPDALLDRGRVYSKLNREDKAAADWEKFLTLAPNAADAEMVRGYLATARQSTSPSTSAANSAVAQTEPNSLLWDKLEVYFIPVNGLGKEIDALAAELKTKTVTYVRADEIYARIEQNSIKIMAATNKALKALNLEPDSADKTIISRSLQKDVAAMKENLEAVAEERYLDLKENYDANVELLKPLIAALKTVQTNDDRRKYLMEIARFSREDKAIAQKVIAQYLRFAKDQTVWGKLLIENENNLKYVEQMKLKYKIVF